MKGLLIIIVVFVFVGTFSVVIPEVRSAFQALRRQRQNERARARKKDVPEPGFGGPRVVPPPPPVSPPPPPPPVSPTPAPPLSAPPPVQVVREPVRNPVADQVGQPPAPAVAEPVGDRPVDPARLWEEARAMKHRFAPDEIKDKEYLQKVQAVAELGHVEAMAKLGTYAFRNKRYVEAFYWRWRAEANGWGETEKPTLREIRLRWMRRGCRAEHSKEKAGNIRSDQASFARAVLRLQCGVDPAGARQHLRKLVEWGSEDAKLFLARTSGTSPR